jgi:hypothetical protein
MAESVNSDRSLGINVQDSAIFLHKSVSKIQ